MGQAAHLMTATITVARLVDHERISGDPIYGDQFTMRARVERRVAIVIRADGSEAQANTQITSESELKESDRIWLPGADTSDDEVSKRPIEAAMASTPSGFTLYEVRF